MSERASDAARLPVWPFGHPPRGTCVEGCPLFGGCHCRCGARTRVAGHTDVELHRARGMPHVFTAGHHLRVLHPRVGAFARTGVEVERVRPLIFWLRDRHGSIRAVAERIGVRESTLRGYAYKQGLKRVPPEVAARITRHVLAFRAPTRAWNTWE